MTINSTRSVKFSHIYISKNNTPQIIQTEKWPVYVYLNEDCRLK
jgi:hypothetical protein